MGQAMNLKKYCLAALVIFNAIFHAQAQTQEPAPAPAGGTVQLGRLLRDSVTDLPIYACDLRQQFNQCRQYAVGPGNAELRIKELSDACGTLEGKLSQTACPQTQVIAQCKDVRFRRDAVYDAYYYAGAPSDWTVEKLQEVCKHLPGEFVAHGR